MNLCEGRVGRQEAAAVAGVACVTAGIFAVNTRVSYVAGNAAYVATLFAAAAALGVFCVVAAVMRARGCDSLHALYRFAGGSAGGYVLSLLTALTLLYAAVVPLARMLNILSRYIFVESDTGQIALYFLPVVVVLAYMGLETITRTSRLFVMVILLSILVALVIALPVYESYRLYPLLGGDARLVAAQSLSATVRYLPVLFALLVCGRGVQGVSNVSRAALIAVIAGALVAALVQFCEGMAYSHETLASIPSPLYRLTAAVRSGGAYLRTDKLLLFFWLVGALLSAGFLCYAAALLYTRAAGMRDTRPSAAVFAVLCCALTLLAEMTNERAQRMMEAMSDWVWLPAAAPPLIAAGLALLRRRKNA